MGVGFKWHGMFPEVKNDPLGPQSKGFSDDNGRKRISDL